MAKRAADWGALNGRIAVITGGGSGMGRELCRQLGHNNVIVGSGVLHTHLRRRWAPTDALLHGVLETCARSRAGLGQILAPRTVFSHREPSKIG